MAFLRISQQKVLNKYNITFTNRAQQCFNTIYLTRFSSKIINIYDVSIYILLWQFPVKNILIEHWRQIINCYSLYWNFEMMFYCFSAVYMTVTNHREFNEIIFIELRELLVYPWLWSLWKTLNGQFFLLDIKSSGPYIFIWAEFSYQYFLWGRIHNRPLTLSN